MRAAAKPAPNSTPLTAGTPNRAAANRFSTPPEHRLAQSGRQTDGCVAAPPDDAAGPSEEGEGPPAVALETSPAASEESPAVSRAPPGTRADSPEDWRCAAEAPTIVLSPYSDLDEEIFGLGQGGGADAGAPGRRRPGHRGRTLREHLGL